MNLFKRRPKDGEADLKLIVAQGEAILARLEEIDRKIEKGRKESKELDGDRTD